mmetsp:Transcript_6504/g.9602  ORF Transcript_6504/g.9602 Transcript_6504/m.9602 type:complete len:218 (+) Transcript_6504:566-1219(+)
MLRHGFLIFQYGSHAPQCIASLDDCSVYIGHDKRCRPPIFKVTIAALHDKLWIVYFGLKGASFSSDLIERIIIIFGHLIHTIDRQTRRSQGTATGLAHRLIEKLHRNQIILAFRFQHICQFSSGQIPRHTIVAAEGNDFSAGALCNGIVFRNHLLRPVHLACDIGIMRAVSRAELNHGRSIGIEWSCCADHGSCVRCQSMQRRTFASVADYSVQILD